MAEQPRTAPRLTAAYFDGRSARARPVQLWVDRGTLNVQGDGVALQWPVHRVQWPERQRHGERQAHLPDEGLLSTPDAAAWDAWAAASGLRADSLTVRWMQSWRAALGALALAGAVLAGGYVWGLPAAARQVALHLPAAVHQQIGDAALASFQQEWLRPSRLPADRQAALRTQFTQAVRRTPALAGAPAWTLHFHASPARGGMGPNAFALPGGHIVVTDELVALLHDRPDVLLGVLGHELGHVQHQHGMRAVVQVAVLSAVASLVLGDLSSLLTAAPVLLGQAAYSRRFEHEADQSAAALMRANGWDPAGFAVLFDRLRAAQASQARLPSDTADPTPAKTPDDDRPARGEAKDPDAPSGGRGQDERITLPIGLSTHPPDAERVRRMKETPAP
jgi:Zn-dependent protease with chaperone function